MLVFWENGWVFILATENSLSKAEAEAEKGRQGITIIQASGSTTWTTVEQ